MYQAYNKIEMTSILDDFKIFKQLNSKQQKSFKLDIRKFAVFEHGAICVTVRDHVFIIGEQFISSLGYDNNDQDYYCITELCDKNIEEFFTSRADWMIVRNKDNKIFRFGKNDHGQLGRGKVSSNTERLKAEEIHFPDNKNIVDISCGKNHCLALSSDFRVYGWGDNSEGQVGCGNNGPIITEALQIEINESVKHIHCDSLSSFAVTITDQVYCWGNIRLKNGSILKKMPLLLNLEKVSKIYQDHIGLNLIILRTDGKVFTFDGKYQTEDEVEFADITQVSHNKSIALLPTEVERGVHELSESGINVTNYFHFNDYLVHKHYVTNGTLLITNEDSIQSKHIQINGSILNIVYKNIFEEKYDQFEEIAIKGEGTFGKVFEVIESATNERFAIKILEPKSEQDLCKNDLQTVMKEIRIMAQLKSQFVVKYIKSWIEAKVIDRNLENYVYIQMEFCPKNLENIIEMLSYDSFTPYECVKYFIRSELLFETMESLQYLHNLDKPIIHRDIKPGNILITFGENGRFVKLCDFGLAKFFEGSMSNSSRLGTQYYMAPEVLGKTYNLKSDVYSLAVVITKLFEIKTKTINKMHQDHQGVLQKYSALYSNQTLKDKFIKLFGEVLKMSTKEYKDRPDSKQLLTQAKEWRIEKDLVTNLDNINELTTILDEPDNKVLKLFLRNKLIINK